MMHYRIFLLPESVSVIDDEHVIKSIILFFSLLFQGDHILIFTIYYI
jgi:hypothetical protein